MKKLLLLLVLLIPGCELIETTDPYKSFDEISQPYISQYGMPEETYEYYSGDYDGVVYYWWAQGVSVDFGNTIWDNINGWYVESINYFTPI